MFTKFFIFIFRYVNGNFVYYRIVIIRKSELRKITLNWKQKYTS